MDDLRTIKGNITKAKILSSSLDIICSSGVEGLSASKITSMSGISKSSVFHHFSSINDIPFIIMADVGDDKRDEVSTFIYSTLDGMGMHFLLNSDEEVFKKVWIRFLGLIIKDLEH